MTTIEKLNAKYANDEITRMANAGDWAGAARRAAACAMWGLWAECRAEAGLTATDDDRNAITSELVAARRARFAK